VTRELEGPHYRIEWGRMSVTTSVITDNKDQSYSKAIAISNSLFIMSGVLHVNDET
jgi:hypothetical protein